MSLGVNVLAQRFLHNTIPASSCVRLTDGHIGNRTWDVNHRCDAGQARLRTEVLAFEKVRDVPRRGTVADVTEWMVSDGKHGKVYFLQLPLVFNPARLLMQYPRSPAGTV